MIQQFLSIGGVKTKQEFLKKYPTEASFFRQHPEALALLEESMPYLPTYGDMAIPQAMYGIGMAYGGAIPRAQYGVQAPPNQSDYPDYESFTASLDNYIDSLQQQALQQQADTAQSMQQGTPIPDYVDVQKFNRNNTLSGGVPKTGPGTGVNPSQFVINEYKGPSVVDFLASNGYASDFNTRKELARMVGISNYRGTASQNRDLINLIQQNPNILDGVTSAPRSEKRKSTISSKSSSKQKDKKDESTSVEELILNNSGLPSGLSQYLSSNPNSFTSNKNAASVTSSSSINKNSPNYGKKVDPYSRIIENDPRSQANINSRKRKEFTSIQIISPNFLKGISFDIGFQNKHV
jgi:hypothetical protein